MSYTLSEIRPDDRRSMAQVRALLEQEGGRSRALLLACGFHLAEENTHTARYVCRFETQNWRE